MRFRMVDARSRRCCGERGLNEAGMRILSMTSAGTGKSVTASRLTCRPSVSTRGPGQVYSAVEKLAPRGPGSRAWPA